MDPKKLVLKCSRKLQGNLELVVCIVESELF